MRIQKGYIYGRCGHWRLRYNDDLIENGEVVRKQVSATLAPINDDYPDKRSVRPLAAKILAPVNAGDVRPESTQRVAEFIETVYLPDVQQSKRRSTHKNYSDIYKIHVRPR